MATSTGRLTRVWATAPSIASWITTVNHKAIGLRYIATALVFFAVAGLFAVAMRVQLAIPANKLLGPETYNQFFSVHGITMIFFFASPIELGIATFVVPLMIGAREMAFPRLNAFGYWAFLFAGLMLYASFLAGAAPDAGWVSYAPNSGPTYGTGLNIDFYSLPLLFLAISMTAAAINFIVTILKMRAPGMSINRMPLFLWAILATSFAVIFALPSLSADNLMLEIDRKFGAHFFDPAHGGNALLWQHVFWIFGDPYMYIILLPAVGIVSTIIPVFSRRPLVGYIYAAMAIVATGIMAFGVWVRDMFTVGLPGLSYAFFGAASALIAIPSGILFFAWIATVRQGKVVWKAPLLFVVGFVITTLIGGVTAVMLTMVPFDQLVHNSYFVVGYFHYMLLGSAVFAAFAGFIYWFPKMTGKMLNELLGQVSFWIAVIGGNILLFPMYIVGILGMPRHIYTYPSGLGWDGYNLAETIGGFIVVLSVFIFVVNVLWSLVRGKPAGDNPWEADTLEWATPSPPPAFNFISIPIVSSRNPLWAPRDEGSTIRLDEKRRTLGTTVLDAQPDGLVKIPEESLIPFILALALAAIFVGFLLSAMILGIIGAVATVLAIAAWNWPVQEART